MIVEDCDVCLLGDRGPIGDAQRDVVRTVTTPTTPDRRRSPKTMTAKGREIRPVGGRPQPQARMRSPAWRRSRGPLPYFFTLLASILIAVSSILVVNAACTSNGFSIPR